MFSKSATRPSPPSFVVRSATLVFEFGWLAQVARLSRAVVAKHRHLRRAALGGEGDVFFFRLRVSRVSLVPSRPSPLRSAHAQPSHQGPTRRPAWGYLNFFFFLSDVAAWAALCREGRARKRARDWLAQARITRIMYICMCVCTYMGHMYREEGPMTAGRRIRHTPG